MNTPRASEFSPEELQRRFVLHPKTPLISHPWISQQRDDMQQLYAFQWDGEGIGDVEVTVHPHQQSIVWTRFFPFAEHPTYDQLLKRYGEVYLQKRKLNLSITDANNIIPEHLHKKGIGTLAHILVVRSLCLQLMKSAEHKYVTRYYGRQHMDSRLLRLLERLDVAEMADASLPLLEVREKMERKAKKIFGFSFEELPS